MIDNFDISAWLISTSTKFNNYFHALCWCFVLILSLFHAGKLILVRTWLFLSYLIIPLLLPLKHSLQSILACSSLSNLIKILPNISHHAMNSSHLPFCLPNDNQSMLCVCVSTFNNAFSIYSFCLGLSENHHQNFNQISFSSSPTIAWLFPKSVVVVRFFSNPSFSLSSTTVWHQHAQKILA